MMDFENFGTSTAVGAPLSQVEKAAAVLLAMGKGVAGKLLKYFTQSELQAIIAAAPPSRLTRRPSGTVCRTPTPSSWRSSCSTNTRRPSPISSP
jgi:hypothetical protein